MCIDFLNVFQRFQTYQRDFLNFWSFLFSESSGWPLWLFFGPIELMKVFSIIMVFLALCDFFQEKIKLDQSVPTLFSKNVSAWKSILRAWSTIFGKIELYSDWCFWKKNFKNYVFNFSTPNAVFDCYEYAFVYFLNFPKGNIKENLKIFFFKINFSRT